MRRCGCGEFRGADAEMRESGDADARIRIFGCGDADKELRSCGCREAVDADADAADATHADAEMRKCGCGDAKMRTGYNRERLRERGGEGKGGGLC